ncbi:hypothetical protein PENTCL1PPCAC_9094, partial [Pristionchus entomophagus]
HQRSSNARHNVFSNLHENEKQWWSWHTERENVPSHVMSEDLLFAGLTAPASDCSCPSPFCTLPSADSLPELKDAKMRQKKSIWKNPFNVWYYAHLSTLSAMYPRLTGLVRKETVGETEFLNLNENEDAFWRDFTEREFEASLPPSAAPLETVAKAPKSECSCVSPFCTLPSIESLRERREKEKARNEEDKE